MKVKVGAFLIQNHMVKSLIIENCRNVESESMDDVMKFFYEDSYKTLARVVFQDSNIEKIPFSLHFFFPLMRILDLTDCNLKTITRFDLRGLTHLVALILDGNKLTTLPNGLFMHTPNLRSISVTNNELGIIDKSLFEQLEFLKFANFSGNKTINVVYAKEVEKYPTLQNLVSLEELKKIIAISGLPKHISISVQGRAFKVERIQIIEHSPAIAKLLEENDEAEIMELSEMTSKAFWAVKDFIEGESVQWDIVDPREVFVAARKLQMTQLQQEAAEKILLNVKATNAIEYLVFANTYQLNDVKKTAFDLIRKKFPDNSLPDRLMDEPDKILSLIDAKKEFEDRVAKARQKYNNAFNVILD